MHRSEAESGIPHTSRTGGNSRLRCGLTRYRRAVKVVAHVPAPQHWLPDTLPCRTEVENVTARRAEPRRYS